MARIVKIFGERNTSTNALKVLIEKNSQSRVAPSIASELDPDFRSRMSIAMRNGVPAYLREKMIDQVFSGCEELFAWKHTATLFKTADAFAGCHVIFCVRHPASWLLALHRRPYHIHTGIPDSLEDFARMRWVTVEREGLDMEELSATELYNTKIASYFAFRSKLSQLQIPSIIVRHEDFAVDQVEVFAELREKLEAPLANVSLVEGSTKDRAKGREFYKDYYGDERWKSEVPREVWKILEREVNWSALEPLGYRS